MNNAKEHLPVKARGLRQGKSFKALCLTIAGLSSLAGLVQAEAPAATFPLTERSQAIVVADIFGDLRQQLENKARDVVKGSTVPDQRSGNQTTADQAALPTSQYPAQAMPASTKAKKAEIAKNVEHASSLPLGYFLGRWKPHGGEGLLVISEQKIISTFWRKDDDGKSEKIILEARWSNLDSDSNVEETFGLSKKQTTLAEISKRYEKAQQRYKKDPMDYAVSDPKLSRKAIQTMLPGSYPIMWSYFGGESGEEMIVDKDHMLAIKDDPYGFSVTLYDRIK